MSKIGIITPNHDTFTFIVKKACKHLQKDVRKNYKMIHCINDVVGRKFEKVGCAHDGLIVLEYRIIKFHLDAYEIQIETIKDDLFV